jgi:predicted nucleic acid-binding protein
LPDWVSVRGPKTINLSLNVDAGELEAICLASEINADAVLMDDRAGRTAALQCGVAVIGTIGLLEQASIMGLLDLPQAFVRLRETNARLAPQLVEAALSRDRIRKSLRQPEN